MKSPICFFSGNGRFPKGHLDEDIDPDFCDIQDARREGTSNRVLTFRAPGLQEGEDLRTLSFKDVCAQYVLPKDQADKALEAEAAALKAIEAKEKEADEDEEQEELDSASISAESEGHQGRGIVRPEVGNLLE
jgi:hypothetical protein